MPPTPPRLRRLADPAAGELLERVRRLDPADAAALTRLRKAHPAQDVADAIDLVDARRRGEAKFGSFAERMLLDRVGVEQASALPVARVKATRMRRLVGGAGDGFDLCCGVGGDAVALAEAGFDLTLVDADAGRLFMAEHNVRCCAQRTPRTRCAEVRSLELPSDAAVHLDPDRRPAGKRRFDPADCEPGLDFIERLAARGAPSAIKLAPGVDSARLPRGETQWISHAGRLRQAVLWTGPVEAGHRATRVAACDPTERRVEAEELAGWPGAPPPSVDVSRHVYEADPAVERAELLYLLCEAHALAEAYPGLGLLTGEGRVASPWLTGFELLARMPWREKRVKAEAARLDAGVVEVKTRDKAVDTDRAQKALRGRGERRLTVFVLRLGRRVEAWITRRHESA